MPTTGVVDAFKNLLRHGKHHNHAHNEHQAPAYNAPQDDSHKHTAVDHAARAKSPTQPRAAAELIVDQERQAHAKMPSYKGLENYELVEKMGDGAFSNVYKAIDSTSRKKIAIKVVRKYELNASQAGEKHLNPQFKKKPRVTERANILKEVSIMQGINHPSIVKLLSFSESPEHYFLCLELMEGGELFHQIVKLTYFSENLARHVILQVAEGIRYLHEERGVVHRDIKPENLLFSRIDIIPSKNPVQRPYDENKEDEGEFIPGVGGGGIGRVKIADFGLSKVVWEEQTMTPCGTVGYTAPEIVKDERYSKSVDMWALGCVLYTLLCGFPPFYDESINVLTEKVARGYYTFLSPWWDDISASSKDLITHLLCVDPSQRYTIDEFIAHPWCKASPAPPPPPTPLVAHKAYDSPMLASGGNWEGMRSPGIATLKEAFDITYAVHRMEEEGARRRKYKGLNVGNPRQQLTELNEDEEGDSEDSVSAENWNRDRTKAQQHHPSIGDGRAGPRDRGQAVTPTARGRAGGGGAGARRGFELDMDGATLLERRQRRAKANATAAVAKNSPLRMQAAVEDSSARSIDPGSPMRF